MVRGMSSSSAHNPVAAAAAAAAKPDSLIRKDDGLAYWRNATPDVDGMLGGVPAIFGPISRVDLQGSRTFLARLGIGSGGRSRKVSYCLEGGAGYELVVKAVDRACSVGHNS
ncbi:hypothetical protein MY10362_004797, partial [Beauveria mimosiformis]